MEKTELNLITLEQWNKGDRPKKLYHITPMLNVLSILDEGLLKSNTNKMFEQSEDLVYLANSIEFCEDYMVDLFTTPLANSFGSIEAIKPVEVKYMIFEIDVNKLNIDLIAIDKLLEPQLDNEYIKSFTYNGDIGQEAIDLIPNIYSQYYLREELIERFNLI